MQNDIELYAILKQRVLESLKANNVSPYGGMRLAVKFLVSMVSWAISYFIWLYAGEENSLLGDILATVILSCTTVFLLLLLHDASHKCFSKNQAINAAINNLLTVFGIGKIMWHERHINMHHPYTNLPGKDCDLGNGEIFRWCEQHTWYFFHRYQHYYIFILYPFLLLAWIYFLGLFELICNSYRLKGKNLVLAWIDLIVSRTSHVILFIVIPLCYFSSLHTLLALYLILWLLSGAIFATTVAVAHLGDTQDFPSESDVSKSGPLRHHLSATTDFSVNNRIVCYLTNGLNLQVAHHLFPYISHIHYPVIQPIIKSFCSEYQLPYHEKPSVLSILKSHFTHLKRFSTRILQ